MREPGIRCANLERVTKTPVCVLGLGLIGGSVLRAAVSAGREALGYNRSAEGAQAARSDGFTATTDLAAALGWAAERHALIVLAVPMPAVAALLPRIRQFAAECPLTDVISVKGAVLAQVRSAGLLDRYVGGHPMAGTAHSGWVAGTPKLFDGAPWVVSVDDHVDAAIWAQVMHLALDCGAVVVPAKSDEHDAAVAAISHLPHLFAEVLAANACEVPLAFALAAGSFRDGTRVAVVAEVDVNLKTGKVHARRFVVAHDCGLVVNPQLLTKTIEGCVVMGLSRAMHEEVMFSKENVTSVDWMTYPILDITERPHQIDVVLVNRPDQPPGGAGEPALRPIAGAVANAVFDATGVRLRQAPFTPDRLKAGLA